MHFENALKISGHRHLLHAETRIAADCHAVLARHGDQAGAVVLHDRLARAGDGYTEGRGEGCFKAMIAQFDQVIFPQK